MSRKTDFALLGILTQGPQSGYDIKKNISQSIGNFWHESYGQLYPTLKDLVHKGFATMLIESNEGKPHKKVYSITEQGKTHLKNWLEDPIKFRPNVRHELLLKVFFGSETSPENCLNQLEIYKSLCETDLIELTNIKAQIELNCAQIPASKYWLFTVAYGLNHVNSEINWCDETIEALKKEIK